VRSIGASSQPASRSCGVAEARAVVCSAHVAPQATDRLKLCVRLPIRPASPNHARCLCRRFKARLGQKRTNVLKCCWCVVLVPTLVDFVATFVGMPALASLKLLKLVRVVGFLQPVSYGEHQLLFERAGLLLRRGLTEACCCIVLVVCVACLTHQAKQEAVRDANGDGALLAGERYHLFNGANPSNTRPIGPVEVTAPVAVPAAAASSTSEP
jgi:hypothetical protein